MKTPFVVTCMLLAAFQGSSAYASQWCEGKIDNIYTGTDGSFYIWPTFRKDWVKVCSVSAEWKGVNQKACEVWVSSATTGLAADKTFTLWYDVTDCSVIPTYDSAPAPAYIMLKK